MLRPLIYLACSYSSHQIKHAVGSARSIARENKQPFHASHIDTVLEVVEAWNVAKRKP